MIERCGVAALAVHGRYVTQRPRDPAHWPLIANVAAAVPSIPVLANGDVFCHADFARCAAATGTAAAMCARGAQWNASIFRAGPLAPPAEVRQRYAEACIAWDNPLGNSKYVLREMLGVAPKGLCTPEAVTLHAAKTQDALAAAYGLAPDAGAALRAAAAAREAARQRRAESGGGASAAEEERGGVKRGREGAEQEAD